MAESEKEEKVCELLITFTTKRVDKTIGEYLGEDEIIRGEQFKIRFRFENIGEEDFPGGKIDTLGFFALEAKSGLIVQISEKEREIPRIDVGQSAQKEWEITTLLEGVAGPSFRIIPKEKCKILYYTSKEEKGKDYFSGFVFNVVNREQIEIINLLKKVLKELGKEKK